MKSNIEYTLFNFLETAASLERRIDRSLSIVGISFSEYRILRSLYQSDSAALPRIDLATRIGLTPSAVTRALKPLEKLGYVSTVRNERDARQSLAALTPAGEELYRSANGVLDDLARLLPLTHFSKSETDQLNEQFVNFR